MGFTKGLVISQVDYREYLRLARNFHWPHSLIEDDGSTGFGRISQSLRFWTFNDLFCQFRRDKYSRRVSMISSEGKWKKVHVTNLDDKTLAEIAEEAGRSKDLVYISLHAGFESNLNNEIGFGVNGRGFVSSMYACVPGHLKGRSYIWEGQEREFMQVYALANIEKKA